MSADTTSSAKSTHSSSFHHVRVIVLLSMYLLIRLLGLQQTDASPVHIHRRLMPLRRHQESPAIPASRMKEKLMSNNSSNRGTRDISPSVDEMGRLNRGSGYTFSFIRQQGNRTLTRKETQDSAGFLKGIYWIQDPNGIFRLISYEADPDQRFQAQVLTNRPGEVNVTFPSDFPLMRLPPPPPLQQELLPMTPSPMPPVSLMTPSSSSTTTAATKRLMSRPPPSTNRPDEASLFSFSGQMRTTSAVSSRQVSSNCSVTETIAPADLLMTTGIPTTDLSLTTTDKTAISTSEAPEFETFTTTTAASIAVTTILDADPESEEPGHTDEHHDGDDDDGDGDSSTTSSSGSIDGGHRSSNGVRKGSRERANLIWETTTTTMDGISDSEHETTSGISLALSMSTSESVGEEDVTSTSTSSYSTTFGATAAEVTDSVTTVTAATTTTADGVTEEDSRPPAPVPENPGDSGVMSALRYFLEYRIRLMDGGPSIYRKEGTDSQGKVIGSYMFLVRDKDEDINHKRELLTKRNNMTQELIKIIQV